MPIHNNSLMDIARMVGQLGTDDWVEGTATGGSTTTIVDTSRNEADDYFNNLVPKAYARIIKTTDSAAPVGEERQVTDWVNSTWTATTAPAYTAAPASGDTYVILHEFRWAEIKAAINSAIDLVAETVLYDDVDESVELVGNTYEYPVPSGMMWIYRITQANGEGKFVDPINPDQYRIIKGTDTPRIKFLRFPLDQAPDAHYYSGYWADHFLEAGRVLRVEGFKKQAKLNLDTDVCYLDPNLIWRQAAAILHSKKIRRSDNDPDEHRVQYQLNDSEAQKIWNRVKTKLPAFSKRTY